MIHGFRIFNISTVELISARKMKTRNWNGIFVFSENGYRVGKKCENQSRGKMEIIRVIDSNNGDGNYIYALRLGRFATSPFATGF